MAGQKNNERLTHSLKEQPRLSELDGYQWWIVGFPDVIMTPSK